jgi:hypothetical protein
MCFSISFGSAIVCPLKILDRIDGTDAFEIGHVGKFF